MACPFRTPMLARSKANFHTKITLKAVAENIKIAYIKVEFCNIFSGENP